MMLHWEKEEDPVQTRRIWCLCSREEETLPLGSKWEESELKEVVAEAYLAQVKAFPHDKLQTLEKTMTDS